jgi:NNP family nitrate/nitrite transporter-like MFS transporter
MSLGKAAVYQHIPVYYPGRVGPVGGVVGLIGGLGGFVLPIAFGAMNDLVGVWTSCFMLLFLIAAVSLLWMHLAILGMERRQVPALAGPQYLPESDILGPVLPARPGAPAEVKSGPRPVPRRTAA